MKLSLVSKKWQGQRSTNGLVNKIYRYKLYAQFLVLITLNTYEQLIWDSLNLLDRVQVPAHILHFCKLLLDKICSF